MLRATGLSALVVAGLATFFAGDARAQDCTVDAEDVYALTDDQAAALYECMKEAMATAYAQGDNAVATAYRDWTVTGRRPGPDPSHGDRLLLTFANDAAADTYLAFAASGVDMPVGAILAKESIALKDRTAKVGPLFIMEKVGGEASPETGGWSYSAVQPDGAMMAVPQAFCHDCHVQFEGQDALAYPAEDLRLSR